MTGATLNVQKMCPFTQQLFGYEQNFLKNASKDKTFSGTVKYEVVGRIVLLAVSLLTHAKAVAAAAGLCFLSLRSFFTHIPQELIKKRLGECVEAYSVSLKSFAACFRQDIITNVGFAQNHNDYITPANTLFSSTPVQKEQLGSVQKSKQKEALSFEQANNSYFVSHLEELKTHQREKVNSLLNCISVLGTEIGNVWVESLISNEQSIGSNDQKNISLAEVEYFRSLIKAMYQSPSEVNEIGKLIEEGNRIFNQLKNLPQENLGKCSKVIWQMRSGILSIWTDSLRLGKKHGVFRDSTSPLFGKEDEFQSLIKQMGRSKGIENDLYKILYNGNNVFALLILELDKKFSASVATVADVSDSGQSNKAEGSASFQKSISNLNLGESASSLLSSNTSGHAAGILSRLGRNVIPLKEFAEGAPQEVSEELSGCDTSVSTELQFTELMAHHKEKLSELHEVITMIRSEIGNFWSNALEQGKSMGIFSDNVSGLFGKEDLFKSLIQEMYSQHLDKKRLIELLREGSSISDLITFNLNLHKSLGSRGDKECLESEEKKSFDERLKEFENILAQTQLDSIVLRPLNLLKEVAATPCCEKVGESSNSPELKSSGERALTPLSVISGISEFSAVEVSDGEDQTKDKIIPESILAERAVDTSLRQKIGESSNIPEPQGIGRGALTGLSVSSNISDFSEVDLSEGEGRAGSQPGSENIAQGAPLPGLGSTFIQQGQISISHLEGTSPDLSGEEFTDEDRSSFVLTGSDIGNNLDKKSVSEESFCVIEDEDAKSDY